MQQLHHQYHPVVQIPSLPHTLSFVTFSCSNYNSSLIQSLQPSHPYPTELIIHCFATHFFSKFFSHFFVKSKTIIMSLGKADGNYQRMEKQQKAVKKEAMMESSDEEFESLEEEKRQKGVVGSVGFGNNGKKGGSTAGNGMRCCQAEKCTADLSDAKPYHRRHKVCEQHAKAQVVLVGGIRQRFCQQCSRFHELSEFDETKRSCRRRLAGHNERRRKNSAESHAEGSSRKGIGGNHQLKDLVCGQVDDRGRIKITIHENSTYKHFQIR